jgi:amino acid transporter
MKPDDAQFQRVLSTPHMVFYGLGTIIGAGIYVLVGKVAAQAGLFAPVSFLIAALLAALTGLTYAELTSRFPKSAGAALYVEHGFGQRWLTVAVGIGIALTGVVSAATIASGFVGYFQLFVKGVPPWVVICAVIVLLGSIAAWGIRESVWVAAAITVIEIGGLLLVLFVTGAELATLPARAGELLPPFDWGVWSGIVLGAFLAFYAFIGFEDMVNVAEEVNNPSRQLPQAIVAVIALSTALYLLVALTAVLSLPVAELAASKAPLALLYERATGSAPVVIGLISLFAVVNGALIQIVMASRVFFGMSREGWFPKAFGRLHPRRRSPLFSTAVVTVVVLVLALAFPLVTLAQVTSFLILVIFNLLHLALILIKSRHPNPSHARTFSRWVPVAGFVATLSMLAFQTLHVIRG